MASPSDPHCIKVTIHYLSSPNSKCPSICVRVVPQVNDCIVTADLNRYRVVNRIFCEKQPPSDEGLCDIIVEVEKEKAH